MQFSYFGYGRNIGGIKQIDTILDNEEMTDDEKLKSVLKVDFLKQQVGSNINHKLVDFLCKREIIEKLIKLSVAVPSDPDDVDESFR